MDETQETNGIISVDLGNGMTIEVTEAMLEEWAEDHHLLNEEIDQLFKDTKIGPEDLSAAVTI